MDERAVIEALKAQRIETPSWGYANSGTRFKTFSAPGAAQTIWDKIVDAAEVHRCTGIAPSLALHIPWDTPDGGDFSKVRKYAEERGLKIGAINPNLFQDDDYRLGSIANPDPHIRSKALEHLDECIEIMQQTGSRDLSLWFADGTNYAGQDDLRDRKRRTRDALQHVHNKLPSGVRMLVEYKFYEPAFYSTDLPDWGTAFAHCVAVGPNAHVLIDLGHHAQGVNIAQIVTFLLDEGRLGGFHFNNRKYGDDDLIVGSVNPFELFLIYNEIVAAGSAANEVAFMIDQSHNIEPKVEAMIESVLNCQEAYAKALLVDREALSQAQSHGDVLQAHRIVMDAYRTDVRPLTRQAREELGCPAEAVQDHRKSGYVQEKTKSRRSLSSDGLGSG